MGKRGPPKTPTKTLKARGSWLANRNPKEPQPSAAKPSRPQWLVGNARKLWDVLVPQLLGMNVLAKIDREAVARYCVAWARWRKMEDWIAKHGEVYPTKDKDGNAAGFRSFPQVKIASDLMGHLARLEREFGLTPASRAGVEVLETTTTAMEDEDDKFIRLG